MTKLGEELKEIKSFHDGNYCNGEYYYEADVNKVVKETLKLNESIEKVIEALEQKQEVYDYVQFAKWVATEIFSEDWDDNYKDGFAEIACRKLEKLGIVRANDDEWELVETEESEE